MIEAEPNDAAKNESTPGSFVVAIVSEPERRPARSHGLDDQVDGGVMLRFPQIGRTTGGSECCLQRGR